MQWLEKAMASQVDAELLKCVGEFNGLKARYLDLKKTQRENAKKEVKKRTSAEPNMAVMETWLRKSRENEELFKKMHSLSGLASCRDAFEDDEWQTVYMYKREKKILKALKNPDVCTFNGFNQIYRDGLPQEQRAEQHNKPPGCARPHSQQEFMDGVRGGYLQYVQSSERSG